MNKNKYYLAVAVLGLIFTTVGVSAIASADEGAVKHGPDYSPERHIEMDSAFTNVDYEAWKNLMSDRPIVDRISESDFAKFAEIHALREAGDFESMKVLREELGLRGPGQGQGEGQGMGERSGDRMGERRGDKMGERSGERSFRNCSVDLEK